MISLKDIRQMNSIYTIPKSIIVNKNIVLDTMLASALEEPENNKFWNYDFDVYLEQYNIDLQRPYVWEHYQQNEFINSMLMEKTIESIIVVEHEFGPSNDILDKSNAVRYVIDGKQRLMTIQKFLHNEFYITINDKKVFYKDFDEELKKYFKHKVNSMTAIVYYSYWDEPVTDDMKIILFNYYNFAGTQQTEEHKNKLQTLIKKV